MHKTTVYLPDELKARLRRLSEMSGESEARLIRRAVQQLVNGAAAPAPRLPLFASGDLTLARRVDEVLGDGFGR